MIQKQFVEGKNYLLVNCQIQSRSFDSHYMPVIRYTFDHFRKALVDRGKGGNRGEAGGIAT